MIRAEQEQERRDRCEVNWIAETAGANASTGEVHWDPLHSVWYGGMLLASLVLVPFFTTPAAVAGASPACADPARTSRAGLRARSRAHWLSLT